MKKPLPFVTSSSRGGAPVPGRRFVCDPIRIGLLAGFVALERTRYDLVICEARLDSFDAELFFRQARMMEHVVETPMLAVSETGLSSAEVRLLEEAGCDGFASKLAPPEHLVFRVRSLCHPSEADSRSHERVAISLTVNGEGRTIEVDPVARLLDVLRVDLGLPGTKEGCGEGECGACTVIMDGLPVNSCLVPAFQADGRKVETVESVAPGSLTPLLKSGATQCGACTPGVVMTATWIAAPT